MVPRSTPTPRVVAVVLVLVLCVAGLAAWWFSSDTHARHVAEDLWESREPASYAFDYSHCGGMCAQCTLRITVTDGRVSGVVRRDTTCSDYQVHAAPTIEEVFDQVGADQMGMFTDSSTVTYDPVWGFPSAASMTCGPGSSDCGSGYSVRDFEVLAPR